MQVVYSPCLSQICNGFEPIEYNIDKKPDWNVFLNMCDALLVSEFVYFQLLVNLQFLFYDVINDAIWRLQ